MEPTMEIRMTLSALLVCVDEAAAQVLSRVLGELSIRVESCPDFARAAIRTPQERFDVVIAMESPSKKYPLYYAKPVCHG